MANTKENVVWITGASSGIGKALAYEWVRLGYKVVLSARRKELLEEIALEIKNSGGEAFVVPVDIMEEESIENAGKLKEQMQSLASNLSSLNGVYGGMLSAMNKN